MGSSVVFVLAAALTTQVESTVRLSGFQQELKYQQEVFQRLWETELELRADALPTSGEVPDFRIPYSGHDYPDRGGGTMSALRKYDAAFHGRPLATEWERRDLGAHGNLIREPGERLGLFARIRALREARRTPTWYGHCNGWTAAAIRHAEPQHSVVKNGVVFTPADIKGLLAEIYMYSQTEFLGGNDAVIHPAIMHIVLTNWLGRGRYPVGVETAVGEVVINYPIYAYKSTVKKLSDTSREVTMNITYALNTAAEANKSPRLNRSMYFHYALDLDQEGRIIGGRYYGDSNRVDMLWTPLQPVQGGQPGNERGNPYLDVKEVLAIWRASVPEELRRKWLNVDPTDEDRVLPEGETESATTDVASESGPSSESPTAEGTGEGSGGRASADLPPPEERRPPAPPEVEP